MRGHFLRKKLRSCPRFWLPCPPPRVDALLMLPTAFCWVGASVELVLASFGSSPAARTGILASPPAARRQVALAFPPEEEDKTTYPGSSLRRARRRPAPPGGLPQARFRVFAVSSFAYGKPLTTLFCH